MTSTVKSAGWSTAFCALRYRSKAQVGLIVGCLFLLISLAAAWGQGGPPNPGGSSGRQLEWWPFADTNWLSYSGDGPVASTDLVNIPNGGDGNCLQLDTTNTSPAFLLYNLLETNGQPSLSLSNGTISLWLNPSWTSTNLYGGKGGNGQVNFGLPDLRGLGFRHGTVT